MQHLRILAAAVSSIAFCALAADATAGRPSKTIAFDTDEGTLVSVDVAPDGKTVVFDLLGDLYSLPIGGGEAQPLTQGPQWDAAPRFAADGKTVIFVSDSSGVKNLWELSLQSGKLRRITDSPVDVKGHPNWSHDGRHVVVGVNDVKMDASEVQLYAIDPQDGALKSIEAEDTPSYDWANLKSLRPRLKVYSGVQSREGHYFFSEASFDESTAVMMPRLFRFDPQAKQRVALTPPAAAYSEYKPQLSHDGRQLAWLRQYPDRRTEIRIRDLQTNQERAVYQAGETDDASYYGFEDTTPNYAFTPDDGSLVIWINGKIHRVRIADGRASIIPFHVKVVREVRAQARANVRLADGPAQARIMRWPSFSRDGATMAFAAIGYVWVMEVKSGKMRRLTQSSDFEYMPAISPDGKSVVFTAFTPQNRAYSSGRLRVVSVGDGKAVEVLPGNESTFLLPTWSPDGRKIAAIRETESPGSARKAVVGWTPVGGGTFHEVAPAPASDEYLSGPLYARSLSFDDSGNKLLFSVPVERTTTTLVSVGLDGKDRQTLFTGADDVAGIVAAPDLRTLALTRTDGTLWIVPSDTKPLSTAAASARKVSSGGGHYAQWSTSQRLSFAFGKEISQYTLTTGQTWKTAIALNYPRHEGAQVLALKGGRLITMSAGGVIESGTLVLKGRRIVAVGPAESTAIPADAIVIDVTGKTLIPGLMDTHYHRIGGSGGPIGMSALKLPRAVFNDRSAVAYGVTSAWEPGGVWNDGAPATAELREAGRIVGPRWSYSGPGSVGYPAELLKSPEAARAAVEQHRLMGVDVLKEYSIPRRDQQQWLSDAAYENGMGIVSHIDHPTALLTRVADGYTGGDHAYLPAPLFNDVRQFMGQAGYIWTANICLGGGSIGSQQSSGAYFWNQLAKQRPQDIAKIKAIAPNFAVDEKLAAPAVPYERHRVSRVAREVVESAKAGVPMGVSAHNMPGILLHSELWYLWKAGMPAVDVLKMATLDNAVKLGLQQDVGSLEAGKLADILVLGANPLDDMMNTLSLEYTIADAVIYRSADASEVKPSEMVRR